jgi:hypothetical protein
MKILLVTLFKKLVLAFKKPPVTLKVGPKVACDSGSQQCTVHWRKFTTDNKGKQE